MFKECNGDGFFSENRMEMNHRIFTTPMAESKLETYQKGCYSDERGWSFINLFLRSAAVLQLIFTCQGSVAYIALLL